MALVSSRSTLAPVSSVTFGCRSAGSTQSTSASDLARTRQGNPSQVSQRMQGLVCGSRSSSWMPSGTWNGFSPCEARLSLSAWMRGSWLTAGWR